MNHIDDLLKSLYIMASMVEARDPQKLSQQILWVRLRHLAFRREAAKRRLVIPNQRAATKPEGQMPTSRRVAARKPGRVVALLGIVVQLRPASRASRPGFLAATHPTIFVETAS